MWFINQQKRKLALLDKAGKLVNEVWFIRTRNNAEMQFMAWRVTHHIQGRFLPFSYNDSLNTMLQAIKDNDLTYNWSPVENYYAYKEVDNVR
ncbi:MAG: hypothetical protein CVV11_19760 [Gammaproteobacteria bacterium HGW-Gammaproteobacteria-15]|nr:MAG: hypothetical protein CVV11_19760 [Gammaproteobacteria bacterium HGW-Gammaproteobacteria-15]